MLLLNYTSRSLFLFAICDVVSSRGDPATTTTTTIFEFIAAPHVQFRILGSYIKCPFLGNKCDEALFSEKQVFAVTRWESVNEGFGKDIYRKAFQWRAPAYSVICRILRTENLLSSFPSWRLTLVISFKRFVIIVVVAVFGLSLNLLFWRLTVVTQLEAISVTRWLPKPNGNSLGFPEYSMHFPKSSFVTAQEVPLLLLFLYFKSNPEVPLKFAMLTPNSSLDVPRTNQTSPEVNPTLSGNSGTPWRITNPYSPTSEIGVRLLPGCEGTCQRIGICAEDPHSCAQVDTGKDASSVWDQAREEYLSRRAEQALAKWPVGDQLALYVMWFWGSKKEKKQKKRKKEKKDQGKGDIKTEREGRNREGETFKDNCINWRGTSPCHKGGRQKNMENRTPKNNKKRLKKKNKG